MIIMLDAAGNMQNHNDWGYTSGGSVNLGIIFTVEGGLLKYTTGSSGTITMKYKVFTVL